MQALKARMLELTSAQRDKLKETAPYGFHFEFAKNAPAALGALREDANLQKCRDKFVKYGQSDQPFWDSYFYNVYLIRSEFGADTSGLHFVADEALGAAASRIQAVQRARATRALMAAVQPARMDPSKKMSAVAEALSDKWAENLHDAILSGDLERTQVIVAAHESQLNNTKLLPVTTWEEEARGGMLHCAATAGRKEILEWLLYMGAKPELQDDTGATTYTCCMASTDLDALVKQPRSDPPGAPVLPILTAPAKTSVMVRFAWAASASSTAPRATHYEISWCPNTLLGGWTTTPPVRLPVFTLRQRTGLISGMDPADGYVVRVRLKNANGWSLYSPQAEVDVSDPAEPSSGAAAAATAEAGAGAGAAASATAAPAVDGGASAGAGAAGVAGAVEMTANPVAGASGAAGDAAAAAATGADA